MIYLTTHRARFRKENRSGINGYLYERAVPLPKKGGVVDIEAAAAETGELVTYRIDVPPGGNDIVSYLDVFTESPGDPAEVEHVIASLRSRLARRPPPVVFSDQASGVRFNTNIGLYDRAEAELADLAERAMALLREPGKPWRELPPLTVKVVLDGERTTYQLDDASVQRVRARSGESWAPSPVSIAHHTRNDFETLVGPFMPILAKLITRLDDQDVLDLGGVRFVDAATGATLGEWPPRGAARGSPAGGA
jgi:hypothetical protein